MNNPIPISFLHRVSNRECIFCSSTPLHESANLQLDGLAGDPVLGLGKVAQCDCPPTQHVKDTLKGHEEQWRLCAAGWLPQLMQA